MVTNILSLKMLGFGHIDNTLYSNLSVKHKVMPTAHSLPPCRVDLSTVTSRVS